MDGAIWVAWPKKASGVATDITEDTVREVALPTGLVDVKVCAVDDTWSGLRLCWRKELRAEKRAAERSSCRRRTSRRGARRRRTARRRAPTSAIGLEDEPGPAVPGEVVPGPVEEHRHPVAEAHQVQQVQAQPGEPAEGALQVDARPAARPPRTGGRSWPSSPCRCSGTAATAGRGGPGGSPGPRGGRTASPPGRPAAAGPCAPRSGRCRRPRRPRGGPGCGGRGRPRCGRPRWSARRATSASGLARTPAAQMSVWASITSPSPRCTRVGVIFSTVAPVRTSTPRRTSVWRAWRCEAALNGGSSSSRISSRYTRARWTSRSRKSFRSTWANSSTSAPATSTPVAPPPTITKFERAVVDERPVGVGGLEPAEDVVAQADRVAQAVEGEAVGVGALRPRRCWSSRRPPATSVVERQGVAVLQRDLVALPVDAGDRPLPEAQVLLLLEDAADRVGDVGCVQAGRGHLVQQRLERVEVVPVDERDLDRDRPPAPSPPSSRRTPHR